MRWYIVTLVLSIEVQKEKIAKLQTKQTVAVSPPIPPPRGDREFLGNDVPGHATRLVATQQPDKALHITSLHQRLLSPEATMG